MRIYSLFLIAEKAAE